VIDLHCHLIPGVDDGPATIEDSLALARAASAAGTTTIVATPHIDHRWNVAPESIAPGVAEVQTAITDAGIDIDVLPGGEVALSRFADLSPQQMGMVRLGGGPYLLMESPHTPAAGDFHTFLAVLCRRGESILLAHPERCPSFQRRPERLTNLVAHGVLCSITASSLAGAFGEPVRAFALKLLEAGLVHNVASDSHDAAQRGPDLMEGLEAADTRVDGVLDQADWLTRAVPEAVVSGLDVPASPRPLRRRGGLRRLVGRRRG
jgi:protein-tyrosine phosphatase